MSKLLGRKELLRKDNLDVEKVELSDDEHVYVKQMTGRERDRFEQSIVEVSEDKNGNTSYNQNLEDFRAKLAVQTVCDKNGKNLLQPGDYEKLSMNISAKKLEKIINKAQKINGISNRDKENLVKNSKPGQSGDSTSG